MKIVWIVCLIICSNLFLVEHVKAELDPKVKVVATMSAYGTAGGALLGFASMAFRSNGRAIFQGASLGLWAGLIFGSYVVISHSIRQSRTNSYPSDNDSQEPQYPVDESGPYQDSSNESSYNPYWIKNEFKLSKVSINHKDFNRVDLSKVYLDVIAISF